MKEAATVQAAAIPAGAGLIPEVQVPAAVPAQADIRAEVHSPDEAVSPAEDHLCEAEAVDTAVVEDRL